MKFFRYYFGASLIILARIVIQLAKGLNWLGMGIMPDSSVRTPLRSSANRVSVLVPYTVETHDGRHITLYGIGRK